MNTGLHAAVALAAAVICVGVVAAQGSASADLVAQSTSTPDPSAVLGVDQEPLCLNIYLAQCSGYLDAVRLVSTAVLAGAYRVRPDMTYEPVLVDGVDVETSPFALTYHLRPQARWSDGVPVTADDVVFTLQAIQNPVNGIADRSGYALVTQATKIDAKTVRLVFSQPYPGWKRLFPHILPKHALEGQDFNSTLASSFPVSSGPFAFGDWHKGIQLSLVRNTSWWRPQLTHLNRVVIRFVPDPNARIQAVTNGELTLTPSAAALQLVGLPSSVQVKWSRDLSIEHIDVNTTSASMPLLAQPWFRRALVHALDREKAVDLAYESLSTVLVPCCLDALQNLVHLQQHGAGYVPHFAAYDYSPAKVAQLLQSNGCVLGGDGIFSCGGTRASVKFATTTGNPLRELVQNSLIADADAAGIELVPDNSSPVVLLQTRLPQRDFELILFTWIATGDPLAEEVRDKYACGGRSNYGSYCSSGVDGLIGAAESEVSDAARTALWNQVDAVLAQDAPSIPLFQRPVFLAQQSTFAGAELNASPQGIGWNIEDWRFPGTFTISNDAPSNGVTGTPYSFVFKPVAGSPPHTFTLVGGTLPPGLTLGPAGALEGTPTTAGTFDFSVGASQSGGPGAAASFTVRIREPLAITTTGVPSGTVGAPYSAPLAATGAGGAILGWSLVSGSLPAGLALTAAVISGTPTAPGTATFVVKAGDIDAFTPDRSATKEFTLRVFAPLAASAPANARGIVGKAYRGASPSAAGGLAPYRWRIAGGRVAPGLALDPATGRIAGKPSRAGTFRYTLGVSDAEGRTATVGRSVTIVGVLDIVTSRLPAAKRARMYRAKLTSRGGAAPRTWRLAKGKLPAGVSLGRKTGVIRGKPGAAGTFRFRVAVSDALRQKSTQAFRLTVRR